jgi:hypothetical protein
MVHEADGIHVFWHSDVLLLLSGHKKPDLVLTKDPDFLMEHRVGVMALSPGVSDEFPRQFLREWVAQSG